MTGEPKMDTAAFREYFKPLEDWLKKENQRNGVHVGWKTKGIGHYCKAGGVRAGSNSMASKLSLTVLLATLAAAMFFK